MLNKALWRTFSGAAAEDPMTELDVQFSCLNEVDRGLADDRIAQPGVAIADYCVTRHTVAESRLRQ